MNDDVSPATKADILEILNRMDQMVTKSESQTVKDLMATKDDLIEIRSTMATKDDLIEIRSAMATKDDLIETRSIMATKDDLIEIRSAMATKDDLQRYATKEDLERYATKDDMERGFARLNDGINQVLDVVININNRLTANVDNHEHRIKRLENHAGLAQIAA